MPTLKVNTDWSGVADGIGYWEIGSSFVVGASSNGYESSEITPFVKSYNLSRGRSSELDRTAPGTLTLTLDNEGGRFLPLNASSVLTGSLVPGRVVTLDWTLNGTTYRRFRGKTTDYSPEPTVDGQRSITIVCIDEQDNFQRRETRSTLYTNIKSGCLIESVLDQAGFPAASSGSRFIDAGQDTYDFAFFDQRKIDEVLVDVLRTEYGFGFIRGDGAYVYHDRYFRQLNSTASATFNENMTRATFARSVNDLYTEARVTTLPKVIKGSATIWTLQSPMSIGPSSTASWFGSYIDPETCRMAAGTGVASGAVTFNSNASGTGTNLLSSFSGSFTAFAESFKMVACNGGGTTGYVTAMTVTGSPIVTYENVGRAFVNETACAAYGLRTLTYDANLITDADKGQAFAQFLVNRYSSPSNVDRVSISIVNNTDANWENILARELDSKIVVTNADLALTAEGFFIGYLSENWSVDGLHEVSYTLERFGVSDQLFIVDVSTVDDSAGLGY